MSDEPTIPPEVTEDEFSMLRGMSIGCGGSILLVVIALFVLGSFVDTEGNAFDWVLWSIPVVQWIYLIPLILSAKRKGQTARVQGLIIAGSITVLLIGSCYAMVRLAF